MIHETTTTTTTMRTNSARARACGLCWCASRRRERERERESLSLFFRFFSRYADKERGVLCVCVCVSQPSLIFFFSCCVLARLFERHFLHSLLFFLSIFVSPFLLEFTPSPSFLPTSKILLLLFGIWAFIIIFLGKILLDSFWTP